MGPQPSMTVVLTLINKREILRDIGPEERPCEDIVRRLTSARREASGETKPNDQILTFSASRSCETINF